MELKIVTLQTLPQTAIWREVYTKHGVVRPISFYAQCLEENRSGQRLTLLAEVDGEVAGGVHLLKTSAYASFAEQNIPEISDLIVLAPYRRQGVGERLLTEVEQRAAQMYPVIGLGVGLYGDYGPAQRLYTKQGYIPDGQGVSYQGNRVEPGASVAVDDDLILYWTKTLIAK